MLPIRFRAAGARLLCRVAVPPWLHGRWPREVVLIAGARTPRLRWLAVHGPVAVPVDVDHLPPAA